MNRYDSPDPLFIATANYAWSKGEGDSFYRFDAPALAMAREPGVYTAVLPPYHHRRLEVLRRADVLVLSNATWMDFLPMLSYRRRTGKLTVFALDDDISAVPPASPAHGAFDDPVGQCAARTLMRRCDAVLFISEGLREKYGHLNPVWRPAPNQVLDVPARRSFDGGKAGLAVGWGGSANHLEDMAAVAGPLSRWIMSRDDVTLHIMSCDAIWALFDDLPGDRKKRFAPGALYDYYDFLKTLDVGIAPLRETDYNRNRSDVKFLEYAAHQVVAVAQAFGPYPAVVRHGETGFLFGDERQFVRTLDRVASDARLRVRVADAAREYVIRERTMTRRAPEIVRFYRENLEGVGVGAREGRGGEVPPQVAGRNPGRGGHPDERLAEALFRTCISLPDSLAMGRCVFLKGGDFEMLIRDALASIDSGDFDAASRLLDAAGGQGLDAHTVSLIRGLFTERSAQSRIEHLQRAVGLNPMSLSGWLNLGKHHAETGNPDDAVPCLLRAIDLFPQFPVPHLELSRVLRSMGRARSAVHALARAKDLMSELEGAETAMKLQ